MEEANIYIDERLNQIKFAKLSEIQVGNASRIIFEDGTWPEGKLSHLLLNSLSFNYCVSDEGKKNVFFFSPEYSIRRDLKQIMQDVQEVIPESCFVSAKRKFCFSGVRDFGLSLLWIKQMGKTSIPFKTKIAVAQLMQKAYKACKYIEHFGKHEINSITVMCDAHMIDNILIQCFNKMNIETVSLQHGIYSHTNPITITNSIAKNLLVYGEYTKKECISLGMNPEKIIKVGMPKLISQNVIELSKSKKIGTLGLIFNGAEFVQDDIEMLQIILEATAGKEYDIQIKLHPGTPIEQYVDRCDLTRISKIYYTDISIEKFIEQTDILFLFGSTVYIEGLVMLQPVLVFEGNRENFLGDISWCNFSNKDQLVLRMDEIESDYNKYIEKMKAKRRELTETDNVKQKYIDFYNSRSKQ